MNLLKLAVAFCLMAGSLMFSQSAFGQSEEDKLKTHLYEFAKAYENLPQTKNKQSVLKYFDPGATSNIFVFNIRGKSGVQNGTVDGFSAFMDNLLRSNELSLKYTIVDVNSIEVVENIATAVYKVDYEIKAEDGIWVKGDETVTMAFEKKQGSWKIVHYTYIQREDEKLKGTCACRLFTEDGGDKTQIVSKTTIPAGKSYSTKYDNFELRTVDGN
ncbi:MAG: nuclear transport factor 2 family protein, partial [Bacteroidota bacterium]